MTSKPADVIVDVIKSDRKHGAMVDFIAAALAAQANAPSGDRRVTVVARSLESPVIRAITTLAPAIAAAQLPVDIVFCCDPARTDLTNWRGATSDLTCRAVWLSDIRFLDAHEQMVVGSTAAWVGDCMRRDPAKRDAFESFAASCPRTAALASRSFERMWQRGDAVAAKATVVAETVERNLADIVPPVEAIDAAQPAPGLSTRH